jgi:hypothetical protein
MENKKAPGATRIFHAPCRPGWLEKRMGYARWARGVLGFDGSKREMSILLNDEWGMKK